MTPCEDGAVTARDPWVDLPGRIVGPSLTAAGLAAWVLSKHHHEEAAAATSDLQDALDSALRSGNVGAARVSRDTVESAVMLWETAATLLEAWAATVGGDREAGRAAARLRIRVTSLRQALEAD